MKKKLWHYPFPTNRMSAEAAGTSKMTEAGLPPISSQDPVEDFFETTKTLLQSIQYFFEDCPKTRDAILQLEMVEASNMRAMKEVLIEKWYETLKPYFAEIAQCNDNAISRANIEILDRLDIKQKWAQFEHEDKQVMWGYIHKLTQLACLHKETTPELMQGARMVASRMAEKANFEIKDGRASFDVQTFQAMLSDQSTLMKEMQPLIESITGGQSAPGLNEFMASQMTQFQSFLGGGAGAAEGSGEGFTMPSQEQMQAAMQMLGGFTPAKEVD